MSWRDERFRFGKRNKDNIVEMSGQRITAVQAESLIGISCSAVANAGYRGVISRFPAPPKSGFRHLYSYDEVKEYAARNILECYRSNPRARHGPRVRVIAEGDTKIKLAKYAKDNSISLKDALSRLVSEHIG